MLSQLSQRHLALDGRKGHLRLEGRCVVPTRSSAHGLSCSRLSSPLSGRNSTYRLFQICEASSHCLFRRGFFLALEFRFLRRGEGLFFSTRFFLGRGLANTSISFAFKMESRLR